MYGLPDTLRPLSAAEEQVMLAVWACPGAAARPDNRQHFHNAYGSAASITDLA